MSEHNVAQQLAARVVRELMEHRFGLLAPDVIEQVERAEEATLSRWTKTIMKFDSAEALLKS